MGIRPRIKSSKGAIHQYKKPLREKRKDRKRIRKGTGRPIQEEKQQATEREISEITLKRLHTLGIQKFGSSPFSEHFDRWLTTIETVLGEFESHPNIGVDEQFISERLQTLTNIKNQLQQISRKETELDKELNNLSDWRSRLKQINKEYAILTGTIRSQRNSEIKRLYSTINRLKREQDEVIRMKDRVFPRHIQKEERTKRDSNNAATKR